MNAPGALVAALVALGSISWPVRGMAQATTADSLVAGLASDDWNERHRALQLINRLEGAMPASLVTPVVDLLGREAALSPRPTGEDYGEYVMELLLAAARTDDDRALHGVVALGGIEVSGAVAAYVARRGARAFPLLDSLAGGGGRARADAVQVYAIMLGRNGALLARGDSARILATLLAAAGDSESVVRLEFAAVAARIPLPEALPVLQDMALSDPYVSRRGAALVRRQASRGIATLEPMRAAEPAATILERVALSLEGVCAGARGELFGQCEALSAFLATAQRQLAAGLTLPATEALRSFQQRVRLLAARNLLTRSQGDFLSGNAAALLQRLAG